MMRIFAISVATIRLQQNAFLSFSLTTNACSFTNQSRTFNNPKLKVYNIIMCSCEQAATKNAVDTAIISIFRRNWFRIPFDDVKSRCLLFSIKIRTINILVMRSPFKGSSINTCELTWVREKARKYIGNMNRLNKFFLSINPACSLVRIGCHVPYIKTWTRNYFDYANIDVSHRIASHLVRIDTSRLCWYLI